MQPISSFWWGDVLGPLHRACLRSALHVGHPVRLYCYRPPGDIPAGVEVRDAADVLAESAFVRHRATGSAALFSDRFRYAMLRREPAAWVDADMYFVRPLPEGREYLVGEQEPGIANGAVLKLPPDSALLEELNAMFDAPGMPFWLPVREKAKALVRRTLGRPAGLATMPWGTAGPHALTALLKRHKLWHLVSPINAFYPADWRDAEWIADAETGLDALVKPDTVAVHLWSSRVAHLLAQRPRKGAFLERILAEGAQ